MNIQYNISKIPYIQIVPMSDKIEGFINKTIKEIQNEFFIKILNERPMYYFNSGIKKDAPENVLLLFQFKKHLIATALLQKVEKDCVETEDGFSNRIILHKETIKVIEPAIPIEVIGKMCNEEATVGSRVWVKIKSKQYMDEVLNLINGTRYDESQDNELRFKGDKAMDDLKNIILYGPPGTGKTYNTVNYAVSIIDEVDIEDIKKEDYSAVFERYKKYKENNQIVFTTFHQSYGYEEFIEGIKPIMVNDNNESENGNIQYKIENGIFKEVCDNASSISAEVNIDDKKPTLLMSENEVIWKISLGGVRTQKIKTECFQKGYIRIGWDEQEKIIKNESSRDLSSVDQNTLLQFQDEMAIGDIVLSLYDEKNIDGIGIIIGKYEYDDELDSYKRKRKVKWLATDIHEFVFDLNGKKMLRQKTVYPLSRIKPSDIIEILQKLKKENKNEMKIEKLSNIKRNEKKYVIIIDEINRGNISKIFGELITLIEPSKRIGAEEEIKLTLPYSKENFGVPDNVYIIGTMNTADRSIALLDTALRRRFNFIEMLPDNQVLDRIMVEGDINISKLLEKINKRIEILYDRDHTIGHAYFMELKNIYCPSLKILKSIFKNSIIPLLQEYFYEDYEKIQFVLGDNYKDDEFKFIQNEEVEYEVFGKKNNIDIDLKEAIYKINESAFDRKESYIGIYEY